MDGEKNLKKRIVPKDINSLVPSGSKEPPTADEINFIGRCKADPPEPSLERFAGNFYPNQKGDEFTSLSIE